MGSDKLRVESNERIDISDFRFLAGEMSENHVKQIAESVLTDQSKSQLWIVKGFAIDNPSGNEIRISKGTTGAAILARRDSGTIRYGAIATEGDTTKTVDINTYTNGTYNIYIRFEYTPGDSGSRIFWNNTGDGSEYAQTINTRELATWNMAIENSSPGAEWFKIGEVVKSGGAPVITDQRKFYFEGEVHNSYQSGWSSDGGGVANDRNSDRQQYGVFDFQSAFAAMRQCMEDVKGRGLKSWYERDIGGMNIGFDANPTSGQLAVGDALYYLSKETDDPTMTLDTNDYMQFDRSENELKFVIDSTVSTEIHEEGVIIPTGGLTVGFDSTPVADTLQIGDANFGFVNTGNPQINWESTAYIQFDRTSDIWNFYLNGGNVFTLDSLTATFSGGVTADILTISDAAGEGVGDNLVPRVDDLYSLGNSSYNWLNVYADTAILNNLNVDNTPGNGVESDLNPAANDTYNLGTTSYNWNNIRGKNGYFDNLQVASGGGTGVGADLSPVTNDSYDLGSASYIWAESHIGDMYCATEEIEGTTASPPTLTFYESDASADRKYMQFKHTGDDFILGAVDDSSVFQDHLTFIKNAGGEPFHMIYDGTGGLCLDTSVPSARSGYTVLSGRVVTPTGSNTKTITNADTAETSVAGYLQFHDGSFSAYIPYFYNT